MIARAGAEFFGTRFVVAERPPGEVLQVAGVQLVFVHGHGHLRSRRYYDASDHNTFVATSVVRHDASVSHSDAPCHNAMKSGSSRTSDDRSTGASSRGM